MAFGQFVQDQGLKAQPASELQDADMQMGRLIPCKERERERETDICTHTHVYIYLFICIIVIVIIIMNYTYGELKQNNILESYILVGIYLERR